MDTFEETMTSKILEVNISNENKEEMDVQTLEEEETDAQKIVKLMKEHKVSEKRYQVLLLDAQQREQDSMARYKQLFECLQEAKEQLDYLTITIENNEKYKAYDDILIPNGSSVISLDLHQEIEQFESEKMTETQYKQILLEAHKREQTAIEKHDIIIEYAEELNEQFEQVNEAVKEILVYGEYDD